jgi:prevent-host-death family protein
MKQIGAAEFKAHCLALLDQVDAEGLVVTKRGRPVAKILPIETGSGRLIGALKSKLRIKGSVLSTGLRWDAQP